MKLNKAFISTRISALKDLDENTLVSTMSVLGMKLNKNFDDFIDEQGVDTVCINETVDTFGDGTSFTALGRWCAPAWSVIQFLEGLDVSDTPFKKEVFPMKSVSGMPPHHQKLAKAFGGDDYKVVDWDDLSLSLLQGEAGEKRFSSTHDSVEHEVVYTSYDMLNEDGERIGRLLEINI